MFRVGIGSVGFTRRLDDPKAPSPLLIQPQQFHGSTNPTLTAVPVGYSPFGKLFPALPDGAAPVKAGVTP